MMSILEGGHWIMSPYAGNFKVSMSYREEMPNIIVLGSPYGALKNLAEMHIALSSTVRKAIKEGKIIPNRCWNPRAIP